MTTAPAPHKTGSLSRSSRSSCWKTTVRYPERDHPPLVYLRSPFLWENPPPLNAVSPSEPCGSSKRSMTSSLGRGHVALSSVCDLGSHWKLFPLNFSGRHVLGEGQYETCLLLPRKSLTDSLSTDEGEIALHPYCLRILGRKDSSCSAVVEFRCPRISVYGSIQNLQSSPYGVTLSM